VKEGVQFSIPLSEDLKHRVVSDQPKALPVRCEDSGGDGIESQPIFKRTARYAIKYEQVRDGKTFIFREETDDPVEFDAQLHDRIRGNDDTKILGIRIASRYAILAWVPAEGL